MGMTIEEAIKHLDTWSTTHGSGITTDKQHEEAKKIARDILKKVLNGEYDDFFYDYSKYEARLKADMAAMLTDIQLEIEEESYGLNLDDFVNDRVVDLKDVYNIIHERINALKGGEDGAD